MRQIAAIMTLHDVNKCGQIPGCETYKTLKLSSAIAPSLARVVVLSLTTSSVGASKNRVSASTLMARDTDHQQPSFEYHGHFLHLPPTACAKCDRAEGLRHVSEGLHGMSEACAACCGLLPT